MRIVSLDFLRFFAAFSVAIPHLIIYFSITDDPVLLETITSLAVELFFVLSGFVLCPFLKKIFESTTGVGRNLLIFLVRRWMRTLPLYFLSLTFFVILFSGRLDLTAVKYLVFLQNFLWPPPDFDYFSVSWSLAVEEWFYILFPCFMVVFFAIWRRLAGLGNRTLVFMIGAIAFVAVFTLLRSLSDAPVENWGDGLRRVVLFRIDSIGFGILLYLWRDRIYKIPVAVIFITAIAAAAYLFDAYDRISRGLSGALEFRLLIFAATALFSCAVLAFFLRLESLFQGWMKGISLWGGANLVRGLSVPHPHRGDNRKALRPTGKRLRVGNGLGPRHRHDAGVLLFREADPGGATRLPLRRGGLRARCFSDRSPPGDVVYGSAEFFIHIFSGTTGHPMTKNKTMKTEQIDLPPINPGRREKIYQDLDAAEYGP